MNTPSRATPFTGTVYRDFTLFALAAVAVGLAVSLTLATAIVLAAPETATAGERGQTAESPRIAVRTRFAAAIPTSRPPVRPSEG